jgi:hypothetical protein
MKEAAVQNRLLIATGCGLIFIAIVGLIWWGPGPTVPRDGSARERARAMAGLPISAEVTAASVQAGLLRRLPPGTYNKEVRAYLAAYGITEDQIYGGGLNEVNVEWSIGIASLLSSDLTALYAPPPPLDASPIPIDRGFSVTFRFVGDTNPAVPGSIEHTKLESIVVR